MNLNHLEPSRRKVAEFILSEVEIGNPFPSNAAIAKHMGWEGLTKCRTVLLDLVCAGVLKQGPRTHTKTKIFYEVAE